MSQNVLSSATHDRDSTTGVAESAANADVAQQTATGTNKIRSWAEMRIGRKKTAKVPSTNAAPDTVAGPIPACAIYMQRLDKLTINDWGRVLWVLQAVCGWLSLTGPMY
jgi:hypothetical protein